MISGIKYATIIIDDVLLRENYGYLNYRTLVKLMDAHDFVTTIAFIPFNYSRTDKRIAALFRERPDRFSLCVHGCDHTRGEFGGTDIAYLENKIQLATARMKEHEKRVGIPFDRIMVFPQGIFSNTALDALKKNKYWAAVNTEAAPVSGGRISSDFPFYLRYKPEDIGRCVSDSLFIVLHHDFFRNGYRRLADLVDAINGGSKDVKWDSLGNILRNHIPTQEVADHHPGVDLRGWKSNGYKRNVRIRLRRYASEFRDNYLSKNDFLLNCAKRIVRGGRP